jgi:hypothetical protein
MMSAQLLYPPWQMPELKTRYPECSRGRGRAPLDASTLNDDCPIRDMAALGRHLELITGNIFPAHVAGSSGHGWDKV